LNDLAASWTVPERQVIILASGQLWGESGDANFVGNSSFFAVLPNAAGDRKTHPEEFLCGGN
jgi:hypothetical protein